ncbi:hypothetical protein KSP39_PZI016434 [Platanthera zijinensis]|uniref:Uncharacterized protein n=1 Tax=Platanthera zijinensis TaxID=2320716 RepID=A0AAP0B6P5_9ASPA
MDGSICYHYVVRLNKLALCSHQVLFEMFPSICSSGTRVIVVEERRIMMYKRINKEASFLHGVFIIFSSLHGTSSSPTPQILPKNPTSGNSPTSAFITRPTTQTSSSPTPHILPKNPTSGNSPTSAFITRPTTQTSSSPTTGSQPYLSLYKFRLTTQIYIRSYKEINCEGLDKTFGDADFSGLESYRMPTCEDLLETEKENLLPDQLAKIYTPLRRHFPMPVFLNELYKQTLPDPPKRISNSFQLKPSEYSMLTNHISLCLAKSMPQALRLKPHTLFGAYPSIYLYIVVNLIHCSNNHHHGSCAQMYCSTLLIVNRITMHMGLSHGRAQAYFLNPAFQYDPANYSNKSEVVQGLIDLIGNKDICNKASIAMNEVRIYRDQLESFRKPLVIKMSKEMQPDELFDNPIAMPTEVLGYNAMQTAANDTLH